MCQLTQDFHKEHILEFIGGSMHRKFPEETQDITHWLLFVKRENFHKKIKNKNLEMKFETKKIITKKKGHFGSYIVVDQNKTKNLN